MFGERAPGRHYEHVTRPCVVPQVSPNIRLWLHIQIKNERMPLRSGNLKICAMCARASSGEGRGGAEVGSVVPARPFEKQL